MSFEQGIKPAVTPEKLPSFVAGEKVFIQRGDGGMSVAEITLVSPDGAVVVGWSEAGNEMENSFSESALQKVTPESIMQTFGVGDTVEIPRLNGSRTVVQLTDRTLSPDGRLLLEWTEDGNKKSRYCEVDTLKKVPSSTSVVTPVTAEALGASVEVTASIPDQAFVHAQVVEILMKYGLDATAAEKHTANTIDVAYQELVSQPEQLQTTISDILNNIEKDHLNLADAALLEASLRMHDDVSQVAEAIVVPTSETTEALQREADQVIVDLDMMMKSATQAVTSELQGWKGKLTGLDKRIKQYSEPNSIEPDVRIRTMQLAKAQAELASVIADARRALDTATTAKIESQAESVPAAEVHLTAPITLGETSETKSQSLKNMERLNETLAGFRARKADYLLKLRDVYMLQQTPAHEIATSKEFRLIQTSLENDLVTLKAAYNNALKEVFLAFGPVHQTEVRSAEALLESGVTTRDRMKKITTLLLAAMKKGPAEAATKTAWESAERRRVVVEKPVEVVSGVVLSVPVLVADTDAPFSGLAMEPVDPGIELHPSEPTVEEKTQVDPVAALPETFTPTILAGAVDAEQRWSTAGALPVIAAIPRSEKLASNSELAADTVTDYYNNYPGGELARVDAFDTWLVGIQGKQPNRFVRGLNVFMGTEHPDAFSVLKNLSLSDVRAMIRMPEMARQSKLQALKVEPAEFEKWRNFLITSSMIPDIKTHTADTDTLGSFAEYVFAYDALRANKK